MKVSKFQSDMDVLVEGYEDGLDSITAVKSIGVTPHPSKDDWWNGKFVDVQDKSGLAVVVILGKGKT